MAQKLFVLRFRIAPPAFEAFFAQRTVDVVLDLSPALNVCPYVAHSTHSATCSVDGNFRAAPAYLNHRYSFMSAATVALG